MGKSSVPETFESLLRHEVGLAAPAAVVDLIKRIAPTAARRDAMMIAWAIVRDLPTAINVDVSTIDAFRALDALAEGATGDAREVYATFCAAVDEARHAAMMQAPVAETPTLMDLLRPMVDARKAVTQ